MGPHDVFKVGWEDKSILFIDAVCGYFGYTGIEDCLQESIAVVKKINTPGCKGFDQFIVAPQAFIHKFAEFWPVFSQKPGPLFKGDPLGAIPSGIGHMA